MGSSSVAATVQAPLCRGGTSSCVHSRCVSVRSCSPPQPASPPSLLQLGLPCFACLPCLSCLSCPLTSPLSTLERCVRAVWLKLLVSACPSASSPQSSSSLLFLSHLSSPLLLSFLFFSSSRPFIPSLVYLVLTLSQFGREKLPQSSNLLEPRGELTDYRHPSPPLSLPLLLKPQ